MNWMLLVFFLMSLGLVLVAVEVVVLPGVGLIGFLGSAFVLGASVVAHMKLSSLHAGLALGGGIAAIGLMFWLLPKTKIARSMVLEAQIGGSASQEHLRELVGKKGVATTNLRPAGTALVENSPIDVVSDGEYIVAGTRVRVDAVEGNQVIVVQVHPGA